MIYHLEVHKTSNTQDGTSSYKHDFLGLKNNPDDAFTVARTFKKMNQGISLPCRKMIDLPK